MTKAKSSQNHCITTTEMCDAAVSKVRFDRVQSIAWMSSYTVSQKCTNFETVGPIAQNYTDRFL